MEIVYVGVKSLEDFLECHYQIKRFFLSNAAFPFLIQRVYDPLLPVLGENHGKYSTSRSQLGFVMMIWDRFHHFLTKFSSVLRLVSGAHSTINVASIDEERVGTFIQKALCSWFLHLCNFLGIVNEKHSSVFVRFITVFHIQSIFLFYHDHFHVFMLMLSSCI